MEPNPSEIVEAIKNAPFYQQDDVAKHYSGLKIKWKLFILALYKLGDGKIRISLSDHKNNLIPWITTETDIDLYPELKFAKKDDEVIVDAIIERADRTDIVVKEAKLTFGHAEKETPAIAPGSLNISHSQIHFGRGDNVGGNKNTAFKKISTKKAWWENNYIQLLFVAGAVAGIIALLPLIK